MADVEMMVTAAGLDALVDAQNGTTTPIVIAEVGLTETAFVMAPTLDAVPGEFKRIDSFSGEAAAENIIHMSATDTSDDAYDLRGFGLYLDDGTLFAVYAQAEPLFTKLAASTFLHAIDLYFGQAVAGDIEFGDATFTYPPATETTKGTARIATQAKVNTGTDDEDFVTPLKLKVLLDAVLGGYATDAELAALSASLATIDNALSALLGRTITGGGLASGGGDLSANRVINVPAASGAEVAAGSLASKAATPQALKTMPQDWSSILGLGGFMIKQGQTAASAFSTQTVTFPVAFPNFCLRVMVNPQGSTSVNGDDERWWSRVLSAGQFEIGKGGVGATTAFNWLALGY